MTTQTQTSQQTVISDGATIILPEGITPSEFPLMQDYSDADNLTLADFADYYGFDAILINTKPKEVAGRNWQYRFSVTLTNTKIVGLGQIAKDSKGQNVIENGKPKLISYSKTLYPGKDRNMDDDILALMVSIKEQLNTKPLYDIIEARSIRVKWIVNASNARILRLSFSQLGSIK